MQLDVLKPSQAVAVGVSVNLSGADTDAKLIDLWLNSKGSKYTRRMYGDAACRFLSYVRKPLAEVTLSDLKAYEAVLEQSGLKPTSLLLHQMAIKSLLAFGAKVGYLRWDVGRVWQAKKHTYTPSGRILTEGETLRLIQAAKTHRDRTLLNFLYNTGMRVSEVASLTWENIREVDGGGAVVTVLGKGGKTRSVRITAKLLQDLITLNPSRQGPVFMSQRRRPLSVQRIQSLIKDLALKTLGRRVSPHWLRHCMATHTLHRGLSVANVAAILGHSSLTVTNRYLHATPSVCAGDYLPGV